MTSQFLLQRIYLPPTPKWPQPGRRTWVPAHKGLDPKTPLRRGLPKPPLRKGLEVQGNPLFFSGFENPGFYMKTSGFQVHHTETRFWLVKVLESVRQVPATTRRSLFLFPLNIERLSLRKQIEPFKRLGQIWPDLFVCATLVVLSVRVL